MPAFDIKANKDLIIMIMALGDAFLEKGLHAEAAKRYQQLLDFKVANRKIYINLSKAYIGLKKFDKSAMQIYEKAIQYDPNNSEIHDILAGTFLKEGRSDKHAIEIYEQAIRNNSPLFDKLVDHLGTIYFKNNEFHKCKDVSQLFLDKYGHKSKPMALFLKSSWKTGQYNDAIVQLKKLIDRTEDNSTLLKYLCFSYLEKKFTGELQNQDLRFSYVDRLMVSDYMNRCTRFDNLQELAFYLELKRFYLDKEYWGRVEQFEVEEQQGTFVYHEVETEASSYAKASPNKNNRFDLGSEVLNKLASFESLTGKNFGSRSSLTYEDFKKEGAAIFTNRDEETNEIPLLADLEILVTIALANFEHMQVHFGIEQVQHVRDKFYASLTELLEKYKPFHIWATSDGVLVFTNDILKAVSISIEILNKINRYNFTSDEKDHIHLDIGIHHARRGLGANGASTLKDISTGVKLGIVREGDLTAEDRPIYGKVFQKSGRIFLSSKAYRKLKNANKFKVNRIGQFKLKYMKESLSLHEILWRNPIDDLRFGFIRKLGRFDLITELSNKGAIKVFKAKDVVLQRFVILKVIQSEAFNSLPVDSPQKMDFYRIAKTFGQLHHPNIANIYEVDEDQGLTYIAREFVEGVAITELFGKAQPFNDDRFIKIIYQICKGLQYSHRINHFHLNLKPSNILVGQNDEIKITD
nr:protein kinase [candidate division KSB1 bacterium]NIR70789.1 protein kinase [candidate division KSB1 bacterium]NIS27802.1 protein kinase [candidate division KSB1 bacterium]NIT74684.1 protein kinase [candidate division KSB1 bacterium]NIU28469.1 protein kinase [candidate division KSB1 bacterium]